MLRQLACKTVLFSLLMTAPSNVTAIPGIVAEYQETFSVSTLPEGSVEARERTIQGYVEILVLAGASLEEASVGFSALRVSVKAAGNAMFQPGTGALFEQRLPPPGAIGGVPASPA